MRGTSQRELEMIASADIADRREAGHQGAPGVVRHAEHAQPGRITVLDGCVGQSGVRQMYVAVDEARRDRPIGEIEPRGISRRIDVTSYGPDPVALDEHRAQPHRGGAGAIDERSGGDQDAACAAQVDAKSRCASAEVGESAWESNPPRNAKRPVSGFEDRGHHRMPRTLVWFPSELADRVYGDCG
jgi:hypothetical protein